MITVIIREKRFECHAALRSLFISLLRSLPLVLEKKNSSTFTTPWSCQKNKISFQHYVHDAMIMKKIVYIKFHKKYINCYYVHYAEIMTKKYIFSFQHYYIRYTVMMKKKTFSPIANCYYVHYAVIMTKIYVFISAVRVLHLDHDKKYTFFHFSITFSRS